MSNPPLVPGRGVVGHYIDRCINKGTLSRSQLDGIVYIEIRTPDLIGSF